MGMSFEQVLLRLKEQIQLPADKDVAAALGLSPTAFNDRKKREAFPEDKLLALSVRRPELKLDVTYILTGERLPARTRATLVRTAEAVSNMEPGGDGPLSQQMRAAYKRGGTRQKERRPKYEDLITVLDRCSDDDIAMLMNFAWRLAVGSQESK